MSTSVVSKASATLPIQHLLFSLAPYGLSFTAFSLLYLIVPNCNVALRFALFGGSIATVLFELTKWGFAYYITHFPRYSVIYGALASVVVFLVWMYLSWLIILYGAICCRVAYEKSAMSE
jgi:membrane protein